MYMEAERTLKAVIVTAVYIKNIYLLNLLYLTLNKIDTIYDCMIHI